MIVILDLSDPGELVQQWRDHLRRGGAFVRGTRLDANTACSLALRLPDGGELVLSARAVWAGPDGTGFELHQFGPEMRERLAALVEATDLPPELEAAEPEAAEPEAADDDTATDERAVPESAGVARNVHERLRNLNLAEQHKVARDGEMQERIILERLYGKSVWEPLLRNPRLTHPEVARIARMANLPRPLVELITGNPSWLGSPEVRRALLSNPRLGVEQVPRVLRLMPRHELKLVPTQLAYPPAVRDAARRLLKEP